MFLRLFFFFIKSAFQPTEAKENNLWSRLELKEIKKKNSHSAGKRKWPSRDWLIVWIWLV